MDLILSGTLDRKEIHSAISLLRNNNTKVVNKIDLSRIRFVKPYGLVLLLQLFDYIEQINDILLPHISIQTYMERLGFFDRAGEYINWDEDIIKLKEMVAKNNNNKTLIEMKKISNNSDIRNTLSQIQEQTINILINELGYSENDILDLLVMLSELLNNIPRHSKTYGYICAQTYKFSKSSYRYLSVCISDIGIGIRNSYFFQDGVKFANLNDIDAIKMAVIDEKSSLTRGGNGYKGIKEKIKKLRGALIVKSGSAQVSFDFNNTELTDDEPIFPGTQIEILLPEKIG
jgi:ABC-type transporter Mla MlaB component